MSEQQKPVGPKFLVEIKKKKDVVYSVTIGVLSKEIATEWGEKWKKINNRDEDHKVVVTPVHA